MAMKRKRVLSGMRPTGKSHLGHLHGIFKNWQAAPLSGQAPALSFAPWALPVAMILSR